MPIAPLPEQLVRTARLTRGAPRGATLTRDGGTVLFLRGRAGDDPAACLWALDVDGGTERLLAAPREGVDSYATDRAGRLIVFTTAGALWTAGTAPRLLPTPRPVSDPRPDPAGRHIAYVHEGALRLIGADGTADRAVAVPDGPDEEFAWAPHTHTTAPDGPHGHWWSPDGTRLLLARTDWTPVRPAARPGRRPAPAGTPNAEVTLWLADLDGSRVPVPWDRSAHEYLVGAGWDPHGPYAVVQSRDQRELLLLGIEPGDGTTRVLHAQRDEPWLRLVPGLPARSGSGTPLTHRDLRGTRHLLDDGVPVTPPGLQLRAVLAVEGDDVLFTASEEPTETQLWTYRPGAGSRRLTERPGVHSGARRGGTLLSTGDGTTVRREGRPALAVASYAERPSLEVRATVLRLGPRELRARLHLPSWHRPGGDPLPVLVDPYGGAGAQRVTAATDWRSLVSQWFAEHGFAVLVTDGRGTPGRGPDWEHAVHGDPFGPVLDDQVTALREAARRHPALDLGRVAVRGWSFGGTLALFAVLRRPDVFHAAVAGAAVTDQRLHEAHRRERVLGHPDEHPGRYAAASPLHEAHRLSRPLLLLHGLADPEVPPVHAVRLSAALRAAGRPHELVLLPGAGHQPIGTPLTVDVLNRQVRFLRRHLAVTPVASGPRGQGAS
ncbi:S9 family peptidase [Streptomyces phaeofaciens]|uniref:S9 family peptidase n=1 Tax=Streptomyces phaeofaciens TaxID=68254 RepID=UPI0036CC84AF